VLEQIGFFHHGSEDRSNPLDSLETAIKKAGGKEKVKSSLIVLPEAFNLKVAYGEGARLDFEKGVEGALKKLAEKYQVVFVAGLILRNCLNQRCNTACFIAGDRRLLVLSRKVGCDSACPSVYQSCTPVDEIVDYDHARITALICMDMGEDNARRGDLVKRIKGSPCPILCVPANTNRYTTRDFGKELPEIHVVVANGRSLPATGEDNPHYRPSIIRIKGCLKEEFQDKLNVIKLQLLERTLLPPLGPPEA
jgi:predicted amidohydrolase